MRLPGPNAASAAIVFLAASYFTNAQAQTTDGKGYTPQERSNKTLEHDRSDAGVLCPPEIGPGMTAPTPKTGDRSVIRRPELQVAIPAYSRNE